MPTRSITVAVAILLLAVPAVADAGGGAKARFRAGGELRGTFRGPGKSRAPSRHQRPAAVDVSAEVGTLDALQPGDRASLSIGRLKPDGHIDPHFASRQLVVTSNRRTWRGSRKLTFSFGGAARAAELGEQQAAIGVTLEPGEIDESGRVEVEVARDGSSAKVAVDSSRSLRSLGLSSQARWRGRFSTRATAVELRRSAALQLLEQGGGSLSVAGMIVTRVRSAVAGEELIQVLGPDGQGGAEQTAFHIRRRPGRAPDLEPKPVYTIPLPR